MSFRFAIDVASGFVLLVVAISAGCLNLGGRTTYLQENPETSGRISALETRVGALEHVYSMQGPLTQSSAESIPSPSDQTLP